MSRPWSNTLGWAGSSVAIVVLMSSAGTGSRLIMSSMSLTTHDLLAVLTLNCAPTRCETPEVGCDVSIPIAWNIMNAETCGRMIVPAGSKMDFPVIVLFCHGDTMSSRTASRTTPFPYCGFSPCDAAPDILQQPKSTCVFCYSERISVISVWRPSM